MFLCNLIAYLLVLLYVNYYISVNDIDEETKLLQENNTPMGRLLFGTVFYLALSFMLMLIRIMLHLIGVSLSHKIILFVVVLFIIIIELVKNKFDGSEDWFKLRVYSDKRVMIKFFNMQLELRINFLGGNNNE